MRSVYSAVYSGAIIKPCKHSVYKALDMVETGRIEGVCLINYSYAVGTDACKTGF